MFRFLLQGRMRPRFFSRMVQTMRKLFFLLFLCCLWGSSLASAQDKGLIGLWETADKDAVVEFYPCEQTRFCGRFYWLQDDSAREPSLDDKNNNPSLRKRPLCGLTFLGGFTNEGEGHYKGGWIYSPRHGSTFSANLHLIDKDTLELRGYVFIPLLGGNQTWTRIDHAKPCRLLSH